LHKLAQTQLQLPPSTLNRNLKEELIVARKSKTGAVEPDKIRKSKPAGKATAARTKKTGARKKRAVEQSETKIAPASARAPHPTDHQIEMRAYFISERRRRFDLPGDANSDWIEAKKQLLAEVTQ